MVTPTGTRETAIDGRDVVVGVVLGLDANADADLEEGNLLDVADVKVGVVNARSDMRSEE